MNLSSLGSNWIFWVVLIVIIAFIVYAGLKKRKTEKKERKKREKEVKHLIKLHLKRNSDLSNVVVNYLDVRPRVGKIYKNRDVYDVFVEIKNPKNNQLIVKKAYEIEGFAKHKNPHKKKDKEIVVDWSINREFPYKKHHILLTKETPNLLGIYLKSIFKKNPKKYIQEQKAKYKKLIQTKQQIHQDTKAQEKPPKTELFKPIKKEKNDKF